MERGGVSSKLLLCQVLVGKVFHCKERIDGEALREGFDSHLSPAKHQLIIFSTVHILPSYIVHFEKSDGDFRYMNEMPNSALWPRKKLKWNAALERKTWYMDQSRKSLFFHWRQTKTSLIYESRTFTSHLLIQKQSRATELEKPVGHCTCCLASIILPPTCVERIGVSKVNPFWNALYPGWQH